MSDLSINRDLSDNLLKQAQKAVKDDGVISKTEYENIKKAALEDNNITDKEILFIASLDDQNVIEQLKSPSAITNISIINEKDHNLEVNGNTINVKNSLGIEKKFNEPVKRNSNEKEVSYNDLNKTYFYTIRTMNDMNKYLNKNFPIIDEARSSNMEPYFIDPAEQQRQIEQTKKGELFLRQFGKNYLETANNLVNISPVFNIESFKKDFVVSSFNALKEFEKRNLAPNIGGPVQKINLNKTEPISESNYRTEISKFRNDMDLKYFVYNNKNFMGLDGTDTMRLKILEVFASDPSEIVDYYINSKVDPDGNDKFFDLMKNLVTLKEPEADKEIQKYISRIILNLAEPLKNVGPMERTADTDNKIVKQAQMLGYFMGVTEAAYEHKYSNEKDAEEAKKALIKAVIDEAIKLIPMGNIVGESVEKLVDIADKAVKAKVNKEVDSKLTGSIKDGAYKAVDAVFDSSIREKYEDMKVNVKSMKDFYRNYLDTDSNNWMSSLVEPKYTTTYVNNNKIKK